MLSKKEQLKNSKFSKIHRFFRNIRRFSKNHSMSIDYLDILNSKLKSLKLFFFNYNKQTTINFVKYLFAVNVIVKYKIYFVTQQHALLLKLNYISLSHTVHYLFLFFPALNLATPNSLK